MTRSAPNGGPWSPVHGAHDFKSGDPCPNPDSVTSFYMHQLDRFPDTPLPQNQRKQHLPLPNHAEVIVERTDEVCVGAACHSSSSDKCCGVNAKASIFTAEAVALCMALDTVSTLRKDKFLILSGESGGEANSKNPKIVKILEKFTKYRQMHLREADGSYVEGEREIADALGAAFSQNSFSHHFSPKFRSFKEQSEEKLIDFSPDCSKEYNKQFTHREVRACLGELKETAT
ncbi:hypothetical protein EGW08_015488 [Elysia chlorotica]|uniref:Uncharacterized protein n=1 Tax=Elysia chlorotica TaxID=188477 RepID=A0A433T5D7_ELYCH|nr:hypothetical protein EGW08_015488 [Elysia chlorotica]